MKKFLLLVVGLCAMAVSCDKGPERIPRDEMEEIMYNLLMQDQYVKQHVELRRYADTVLVYEGIFEEYGYDTDDFLSSMGYYLEDPTRMEKIMEAVEKRLAIEIKEAEIQVQEEAWRKSFLRIYNLNRNSVVQPQPRPTAADSLYVQFTKDSLFYHPTEP